MLVKFNREDVYILLILVFKIIKEFINQEEDL